MLLNSLKILIDERELFICSAKLHGDSQLIILNLTKHMKITKLAVPRGIRYISQWEEFKLPEYPNIIDKQIPGCGFTEYCLTNDQNIILVSPRKMLLENKNDQHTGEVFLVKSILRELGVDLDISTKRTTNSRMYHHLSLEEENDKELIERNFKRICDELIGYYLVRSANNLPSKILVTYDSFRKVKETLIGLGVFDQFYVVVDEFQSIFVDSRFKSSTEIEFINHLQDVRRLCYVSATPMLKEYLEILDEFKNLPYIQFDWESEDPGRVVKPFLEVRSLRSVQGDATRIIEFYKSGNFKTTVRVNSNGDTEVVESREAVLYVNSVNNIISIISKSKLSPEEVNILCADTPENTQKLQSKLGKDYRIGRVPTKEEPRKMFTLCTRTVYLGADFYSDNARTFIFSDANIDSLVVDITLDLPQILGRQRLNCNPWKNKAMLYVRIIATKNKMALDDFHELISKKVKSTERLLAAYYNIDDKGGLDEEQVKIKEELAKKYLKDVLSSNYSDDYVAVNRHAGSTLVPVMNNLALISEQRAYDIQQVDYADRFSVFNQIEKTFSVNSEINKEILLFQEEFKKCRNQKEQLRFLCTQEISDAAKSSILDLVPEYMRKFYLMIGPERCRALGYDYSKLKDECNMMTFDTSLLRDRIYEEFFVDDIILKSELKQRIARIYEDLEYKRSPKATDIEDWFVVKRATIPVDGKHKEAFKLIRKLY